MRDRGDVFQFDVLTGIYPRKDIHEQFADNVRVSC